MVELEQMRSAEVVRSVADGRLDFGIVREDAVPKEIKRWKLGEVGYAMFATNALWKGRTSIGEFIQNVTVAELLPGGQFTERWHAWLAKERLGTKMFARVSSFAELTKIVQTGHAAAVLPLLAAVDLDPKRYGHRYVPALQTRKLVLIANERALDRVGFLKHMIQSLAGLLTEQMVGLQGHERDQQKRKNQDGRLWICSHFRSQNDLKSRPQDPN